VFASCTAKTRFGVVQLSPDDPEFTHETLLAMLREARRELTEQ